MWTLEYLSRLPLAYFIEEAGYEGGVLNPSGLYSLHTSEIPPEKIHWGARSLLIIQTYHLDVPTSNKVAHPFIRYAGGDFTSVQITSN